MNTRKEIKDYVNEINALQKYKGELNERIQYGIISLDGASFEEKLIKKKELELKKELIYKVHVTDKGDARKIEYKEGKKLWKTMLPGKKPLTATSEIGLYDKLFVYYGLTLGKTSIGDVFRAAIEYKAKTENPKERTIDRNIEDFNIYISKDFQKRDIRKITKDDLKEYTQTLVNTLHPKKKAFYAYKGILNIIFDYALEKEIIQVNPVSSIKNKVYLKSCDCIPAKAEDKIFSIAEIELIKNAIRQRINNTRYKGYFVGGYMILFAIETGMRMAELCSLKWCDIEEKFVHIHTQLLSKKNKEEHKTDYYIVNYTKNEKGISQGGRYFPINPNMQTILLDVKEAQNKLGIHSEFVFCDRDGSFTTTKAYYNVLYRLCKSLGYSITNNHAFRMSLNSNVLIGQCHLEVNDRAKLLGHTVEVNLKNYTFENKDYLDNAYNIMNNVNCGEK